MMLLIDLRGICYDNHKDDLWTSLIALISTSSSQWISLGNFNEVLSYNEKNDGFPISSWPNWMIYLIDVIQAIDLGSFGLLLLGIMKEKVDKTLLQKGVLNSDNNWL